MPSLSSVAMPRFSNEKNVTVFTYTGANTHIDCAVDNLGQDTVISWVRRRDLHILTIASITYTADRRYITPTSNLFTRSDNFNYPNQN